MPILRVNVCLIAEDLRQELGSKWTVIGLYGATPDAKIRLLNPAKPLEKLSFLVLTDPIDHDRTIRLKAAIRGPDDKELIVWPESEPFPVHKGKTGQFAVGIGQATFPGLGRYAFVLHVDGEQTFEGSFFLEHGKPEDFQR